MTLNELISTYYVSPLDNVHEKLFYLRRSMCWQLWMITPRVLRVCRSRGVGARYVAFRLMAVGGEAYCRVFLEMVIFCYRTQVLLRSVTA
jgi:hypothetical protein